jgi:hypothetical protein
VCDTENGQSVDPPHPVPEITPRTFLLASKALGFSTQSIIALSWPHHTHHCCAWLQIRLSILRTLTHHQAYLQPWQGLVSQPGCSPPLPTVPQGLGSEQTPEDRCSPGLGTKLAGHRGEKFPKTVERNLTLKPNGPTRMPTQLATGRGPLQGPAGNFSSWCAQGAVQRGTDNSQVRLEIHCRRQWLWGTPGLPNR